MNQLVAATSIYNLIAARDGVLMSVKPSGDTPVDTTDPEKFLLAARAKWGFYRVIGSDGIEGPEWNGDCPPDMKMEKLPGGERVFRLRDSAAFGGVGDNESSVEFAPLIDRDEVARVAKTIRHNGDYGDAYIHQADQVVHWTMADGDGYGGPNDEEQLTPESEIKKRFAAIPGVKKVVIGDEWSPKEENGWTRVRFSVEQTPENDHGPLVAPEGAEFADEVLAKFLDGQL